MDKNGIPERPQTLRYPVFTRKKIMSATNWNLSGQSPSILLRKTVLSLKVPTGDFIAALRFANANLSGQSPSILLRKTVLSLKSPTGAFIVLLRSTNANFQISLCK